MVEAALGAAEVTMAAEARGARGRRDRADRSAAAAGSRRIWKRASRKARTGSEGPCRAAAAEAALTGASLEDPSTWGAAMQALLTDFTPMTDMRASAEYRMETARALLAKALMEMSGTAPEQVRVLAKREAGNDRAA